MVGATWKQRILGWENFNADQVGVYNKLCFWGYNVKTKDFIRNSKNILIQNKQNGNV